MEKNKIDRREFIKITGIALSWVALGNLSGCSKPAESNEEEIISNYDEQEISSTLVEDELDYMVEESLLLSEDKNTKAYKTAEENVQENYDNIFDFLYGDAEIAGKNRDEVLEETIEFAEDAMYKLDASMEAYIPDYKNKTKELLEKAGAWSKDKAEKAREWLQSDEAIDKFADAYNKITDLKEDAKDYIEKIKTRAKERKQ